ncbi:MAG: folate family ECF transporter S component [Hydrogenoanaerobacterium sp.]
MYKTPFLKEYWKSAALEVKSLRMLAVAALFVGLHVVVSAFFVPIGENLRIYASFFVTALGSFIYGPVFSVMVGFAGDILGFFIHPSGGFFPGYTLTAMVSGLCYALFLYRARLSFLRVFLCKMCVNIFINVGLGSLWSAILYGKGFYYYFVKSALKNFILLLPEVLLLVLFLRAMLPVLRRLSLVPSESSFK